jgi:NAD(P)-dependent dehydrogenase (short-subunit alcohol dehydrogenase family)
MFFRNRGEVMKLKDKVAVVTGSSRGIGRGIAERFAKDGALVVIHYGCNVKAAEGTVREIESQGGTAFALQADLASIDEIRRFFERLDTELTSRTGSNRFDILVNNAGISSPAPYHQMAIEQFDCLFAVNVRGPFFVTQSALPRLREGGKIINISSLASRHASPSPFTAVYSMTKSALDAFTLALAQDLGQRGIAANTIAPGAVETDMNVQFLQKPEVRKQITDQTALGRIGEPSDIANVAAFLASDENTWVTGQYIAAAGGFRL